MYVMLDFIWIGLASCEEREASENFNMKINVSSGNQTSEPSLRKLAP